MSICGIDEAGRGTLAGSLFISGTILKKDIPELKDSKKLSPKKREKLFTEIIENSDFHIAKFSAELIDEVGISEVLKRGLLEIMENLKAEKYIFDGKATFGVSNLETIVGGDDLVPEISASSILSKVSKDREMIQFGEIYENWSFAKHKGYGTKNHISEIREFGFSPIHRKSFKIKSL
jgi:ribonuclease HII